MFMKAWNLLKISEKPVLTEVNDPYIQDNHHVLADISHSALNHRDVWIIKGKYPSVKTPCVLGSDASVTHESEKYVINPGMEWGEKTNVSQILFILSECHIKEPLQKKLLFLKVHCIKYRNI
jgi:hypothetical protein